MRRVVVELVGRISDVEWLRRHLPSGWQVRHGRAGNRSLSDAIVPDAIVPDAIVPDAIVMVRPPAARVRRTRWSNPATPIIAVIDATDPVRRVVELIEAGADACVRASRPDLLLDQLRAIVSPPQRRWLAA